MRRILFILFIPAALWASCSPGAPAVQIGSATQPAVPINAPVCVPVGPIQVGPTSRPLVDVTMPMQLQVGPTTQPLVTLSNPVTVSLPDMTLPAGIIAVAIVLALVIHVLWGNRLASRRLRTMAGYAPPGPTAARTGEGRIQ